jgi:hypothetical protein
MALPIDPELQRIRDVTANFFFWQGLRWVPIGAALLLFTWSTMPSFPLSAPWRDAMPWITLALGLGASWLCGKYYARTYGQVRTLPGLHARRDAIKWGIVYPAMGLALIIDDLVKPPIAVSGLVFALGIEAYRRSTGGGRRHYLLASAMFAVATVAPTLGLVQPGRDVLAFVLGGLGSVYLIGGVLDHLELRRMLQAKDQHDHVGTV